MSETTAFDPIPPLSKELNLPLGGVSAVVRLLSEGSTVPFIARYRKEATGNLDEEQIRAIEERHGALVELHKRRETVLASIAEQGKLTEELRAEILACATRAALEDLYLPYRPKRRTRATVAREKGLEPLADLLWQQPGAPAPLVAAAAFVDAEKGVETPAQALAGARDIVAERVSEDARLRGLVREVMAKDGVLTAEVTKDKEGQRTKFEAYYGFRESLATIPSHRFLAVRRGEKEEVLRTRVELEDERLLGNLQALVGVKPSPWQTELSQAVEDGYRRLVLPSVENDVRTELKLRADEEAIGVFASNLRNLLLSPPLGPTSVVGIDPGLRTGCKCAALDPTGRVLGHATIYPHQGEDRRRRAAEELIGFLRQHGAQAVAVGNGTAGRETEAFVREAIKASGNGVSQLPVLLVSESGASVYSASPLAREEFPDLDVTIRGAISIARRLQDPLAELVKIDPRSIGVGQYQHDVNPGRLKRKLDDVVESCVNAVGVELNTASAPLLSYVAGIGETVAKRIVTHRETQGPFPSRKALLKVAGVGPRTFQQAAGFLRIREGEHPLDASAVHPERYDLVAIMARDLGVDLAELVGSAALAGRIDLPRYATDEVGEPTLRDILGELAKPGRDPRAPFEAAAFREDVTRIEDLTPGMTLEGVVTNVTHFGAFVDVGVKEDGLVHVSQLADRFVKDPREVARVGERLTVRVLEVDLDRKRISLTCRSDAPPARRSEERDPRANDGAGGRGDQRNQGGQAAQRRPGGEPSRDRDPRRDPRDGRPQRDRGTQDDRGSRGKGDGGFRYNPFADLLKK